MGWVVLTFFTSSFFNCILQGFFMIIRYRHVGTATLHAKARVHYVTGRFYRQCRYISVFYAKTRFRAFSAAATKIRITSSITRMFFEGSGFSFHMQFRRGQIYLTNAFFRTRETDSLRNRFQKISFVMEAIMCSSFSVSRQRAYRGTYFRYFFSADFGKTSMFLEGDTTGSFIFGFMTFTLFLQGRFRPTIAVLAATTKLALRRAAELSVFTSNFTMDGLQFTSITICFGFTKRTISSSVRVRFTRTKSSNLTNFDVNLSFRHQIFFDRADRNGTRFFLIDFNLQFGNCKGGQVQRFRLFRSSQIFFVTRHVTYNHVFRASSTTSITHMDFLCFFTIIDIRPRSATGAFFFAFYQIMSVNANLWHTKMGTRRYRFTSGKIDRSLGYRYKGQYVIVDFADFFFIYIKINTFSQEGVRQTQRMISSDIRRRLSPFILMDEATRSQRRFIHTSTFASNYFRFISNSFFAFRMFRRRIFVNVTGDFGRSIVVFFDFFWFIFQSISGFSFFARDVIVSFYFRNSRISSTTRNYFDAS